MILAERNKKGKYKKNKLSSMISALIKFCFLVMLKKLCAYNQDGKTQICLWD